MGWLHSPAFHRKKAARQISHLWPRLTPMWRFFLLIPLWFSCGCDENISTEPTLPANIALEQREGLYYKPGQDTPFSGTIQRKHKNGRQSFEAVYANGLKLLQRSWYNNGAPNDEYRFHEGHIVVRHDWDDTGKLQTWRKLELLTQEQFVRAAQYATNKPPDLQKAYLWFHIAAANGHLDSRQLLRNPPEGITQEEFAKVKLKADQLLGNESKKSGNLTAQNASKKR